LALFTLDLQERPSAEQLGLIRNGATYTVGLGKNSGREGEAEQLRGVMFFVFKEAAEEATLLGFIDFAPPRPLTKDENVVAMLDLLGFSNIMASHSLDEIERRFTVGVLQLLWLVESLSAGIAIFHKRDNLSMPREAAALEYGVISDTIVLYPKNNAEQPLVVLCEAVSLLMDWALQTDWLLRGAIAIGSFKAIENRPIYLGSALVAAHSLEVSQEWSGCILAKDVVTKFAADVNLLLRRGVLVHAKVPFKTQDPPPTASDVAVNWCFYRSGNESERTRKLRRLAEQASELGKGKIERTLAFLEEMELRQLAGVEAVGLSEFGGEETRGAEAQ